MSICTMGKRALWASVVTSIAQRAEDCLDDPAHFQLPASKLRLLARIDSNLDVLVKITKA